jgi:beta-galactosidase
LPDFDDKAWSASRNPQAMEAYDDFQNRYGWYRATIRCDAPEMRNLRFSGLSGDFQAFLNGRPADLSKLDLKQGENTLAIFSRIGPRPKLFLFMGLIGTNGARGLWGPTYSGERPIIGTSEWKMTKVADKTDTSEDFARPGFDDKTWQTIGTGSFDAKAGEIFRLRTSFDLPSQEGPILALLPEASKESQRIFLNGKPLPVGKRDNGGFDATSYLVPGRNTLAMEFIAKVDKKNEKAWVNPRFELWRPDEPLTWKFRGGLEGLEETAIIGRVLNWREFLDKPWSTTEPGAGEFPRFWKTTFSFSPKNDETIGLDVTGLGNGHIWVNGHNLGGTPQTVPLYIPECWLNKGPNEIVVFDTQGRKPESLRLVGYESHQIVSAGR